VARCRSSFRRTWTSLPCARNWVRTARVAPAQSCPCPPDLEQPDVYWRVRLWNRSRRDDPRWKRATSSNEALAKIRVAGDDPRCASGLHYVGGVLGKREKIAREQRETQRSDDTWRGTRRSCPLAGTAAMRALRIEA